MKLRTMVQQYEEELGNCRWVDYITEHRTEQSLITALHEGVRHGDWGGYRLITIHREVIGNETIPKGDVMPTNESQPRDLYFSEMVSVKQITIPEGMLCHGYWYVFDGKTKTLRPVTTEEIYHAAETMDSNDGMH